MSVSTPEHIKKIQEEPQDNYSKNCVGSLYNRSTPKGKWEKK